ncbi:MAG: hypothetical protein K8J08_04625 [Thermoanaerobaculia bacterium]|nr:hypothetical protein [Thermoanaerobaculia bacterium]
MGGWLSIGLGIVAALLLWRTGHPVLFWSAVVATVLEFWSYGIMHNFAMDLAKARFDRIRENMILEEQGQEALDRLDRTPIHPTSAEINAVPDGITRVNMLVSLAILGLLISGVVIRLL